MEKTIIFDFDGTIVNSRDLVIKLYNELAEKNNCKKINEIDIKFLSGLSINERCKELGVPLYKIPSFAFEVKKNYKDYLCSLSIKEGIIDVLYKLRENRLRLSVVSSNSQSTILDFVKKNNIDIFDNIYSAKDIFGKHNTINGFLKKFNLDKKDVLYIGDEVRDVISCKKSGIKIIAVTWGYDSKELLSNGNPDFIVDYPSEIINIASGF